MISLKRLLNHHKEASQIETVVPDELVKHYPAPPEKLQSIIQRVPNTGQVLYQYIQRFAISKVTKYWAVDMMKQGLETPGIIQLAGEDLNMNAFAYSKLLDTVFRELGIEIQPETAYCAYAVEIADEVLRGEKTARNGFELLSRAAIDSDYSAVFYDFYIWLDNAEDVCYLDIKESGLRKDNVNEWMYQYFEKFVGANNKYSSIPSDKQIL